MTDAVWVEIRTQLIAGSHHICGSPFPRAMSLRIRYSATGKAKNVISAQLLHREELFLFRGADQVVLSFRVEGSDELNLALVYTDKFGKEKTKIEFRDLDVLVVDYVAMIRNLFNFDFRIARRAEITKATLLSIWRALRANNHEQPFAVSRVRMMS